MGPSYTSYTIEPANYRLIILDLFVVAQWGKVHAFFPEVHGTSLNLEKKSKLLVLRYRGSVKDVFNA